MATFPLSGLHFLDDGSLTVTPQDGVKRSTVDAGQPKYQQRYRAVTKDVAGSILVTPAQWITLWGFFVSDCKGGSIQFDWTDPLENPPTSTVYFKFKAPPIPKREKGLRLIRVTLSLIQLP